jgi:large subunit ribosomal protein L29
MPLPKIEDARNLSDEEVADAILAAKRELFQLRLQQATRRLEKPHQFKHVRHRIGQLMTVERERQLAAAKADAQSLATAAPSADAPKPDEKEE